MDDVRETHSWIRHNVAPSSKLVSWRGLGHQLAAFAARSVLGNNLEHPDNWDKVEQLYLADEREAAKIMKKELKSEYIILIFGGRTGFVKDDITRAAFEVAPDKQFNVTDSVLYKLSYKGFSEQYTRAQAPQGFDLVRRQQIGFKPVLTYFDEVFTSEHWLVRVYKLNKAAQDIDDKEPVQHQHHQQPVIDELDLHEH